MASVIAIIAAVCVLSFIILVILAWRAPEMDDNGRIIRSAAGPSPKVGFSEQIQMPIRAQVIRMRPKLS